MGISLTLTFIVMLCGVLFFYSGYALGRKAGWIHGFESGILTEKNEKEKKEENEKD